MAGENEGDLNSACVIRRRGNTKYYDIVKNLEWQNSSFAKFPGELRASFQEREVDEFFCLMKGPISIVQTRRGKLVEGCNSTNGQWADAGPMSG